MPGVSVDGNRRAPPEHVVGRYKPGLNTCRPRTEYAHFSVTLYDAFPLARDSRTQANGVPGRSFTTDPDLPL
jgi:hypothetical protein